MDRADAGSSAIGALRTHRGDYGGRRGNIDPGVMRIGAINRCDAGMENIIILLWTCDEVAASVESFSLEETT